MYLRYKKFFFSVLNVHVFFQCTENTKHFCQRIENTQRFLEAYRKYKYIKFEYTLLNTQIFNGRYTVSNGPIVGCTMFRSNNYYRMKMKSKNFNNYSSAENTNQPNKQLAMYK